MSPSYISHKGVWHPAKERVALRNLSDKPREINGEIIQPGEEYIYKGADRMALFELFEQGVETFGQDFRTNPEFLQSIRNQGFNSVDEYLKAIGYDEEADEKAFKEKAEVVTKHDLPKKVKLINSLGGGADTTGTSSDRYGGFGPEPKE